MISRLHLIVAGSTWSAGLGIVFEWLFLAIWIVMAPPVHAIDPQIRLTQYGHTAWRVRDGYFSGTPNAISQTNEGYIWIGTGAGLVRFDGSRFQELAASQGNKLDSTYILSLAAGNDGSLYVGTATGMNRVLGGKVQTFVHGRGRINQIIRDSDGRIWYARSRSRDSAGPLCSVSNSDVRCIGAGEGVNIPVASSLTQDAKGALWIAGATSVVRWSDGKGEAYTSSRFSSGDHLSGFGALLEAKADHVYAGFGHAGRGLGLEEIVKGDFRTVRFPGFDGSRVQATSFLRDRKGSIWIGTSNDGLYRWNGSHVEHYRRSDGLSGDAVNQVFEDREGVIWVATSHGVDNFRDVSVLTLSTSEGLKSDEISGLAVARDGSVWLGFPNGLAKVGSDAITTITQAQGLPGRQVTSLLQDELGQWWIGVDQGVYAYSQGRFKEVTDNGKHIGPVISVGSDHAGGLWAVANGKPPALIHIQGGRVISRRGPPTEPRAGAVYADRSGGVWVGYVDGSVAYLKGSHRTRTDLGLAEQVSIRRIIGFGSKEPLILTPEGLFGIKNGRPQVLNQANGLPDTHLHAGVFDLNGDLWLMCDAGLLRISRSELDRWWMDPALPIQYRLLTANDGVLISQDPFDPSAGVTPDNRVWFATEENGVEVVDASIDHLQRQLPPVRIEDFRSDHKGYALDSAIHLPPKPRNIMIDYAGLSFAHPADIQFRYRLDGHDTMWMDAGMRRTAYFGDLQPGRYRFRVAASNQRGVWNPEEATVDFVVEPAWYQTRWFLCMSVIAISLLVWVIYFLRVRSVSVAINSRFDERVAERTRMARELHDTFLQTVQSSKMVADSALAEAPDAMGMSLALEKLSEWLGQAVTEGRAALRALRTSTLEKNHLAEALRDALEEHRLASTIESEIRVNGTARDLHPIVRDELCRIGLEAIRNAIRHSEANHLHVDLIYGRNLILIVNDDGIGISSDYVDNGKTGHFGLTGIRERAERIRGKILITSTPDDGTRVRVSVPSNAAYFTPMGVSALRKVLSKLHRVPKDRDHAQLPPR